MIKLRDLLYEKKLTSDDIKVGDAYLKKTRQGKGKHTKYAASSRNAPKKRSRGQGN